MVRDDETIDAAACRGMGFYEEPQSSPRRLSRLRARSLFDEGHRIYMIARGYPLLPQDRLDPYRLIYSYDFNDWHKRLMQPAEAERWKSKRLFEVWPRIEHHARAQRGLNPASQKRGISNYLDYYAFEVPEIQRIDAASPETYKPYELRFAERGEYYYLNWYALTPKKPGRHGKKAKA